MDTNQVIERSEEAVETAAEKLAEAGIDCNAVFAGGLGIGIVVGIALTKYVLIPVGAWAKAKWNSRPPKEIKVGGKTEPPAEEPKETETESVEEPKEK